ncbi:hypothetical protein D8B29_17170 [Verminephrobacter eiseniae]|nr:hypothetical protein [Verminephrobacter eiseniae]
MHRLPIRSVLAARCALRYAPMAARSLRHLIGDATLGAGRLGLIGAGWAHPPGRVSHITPVRTGPGLPGGGRGGRGFQGIDGLRHVRGAQRSRQSERRDRFCR